MELCIELKEKQFIELDPFGKDKIFIKDGNSEGEYGQIPLYKILVPDPAFVTKINGWERVRYLRIETDPL